MKHLTLLLLLFFTTGLSLFAQLQNNNWCVGNENGVTFNTNPPSLITTGSKVIEGCAAISDRHTGKMLFYSNGADVWDGQHNLMPNGADIGIPKKYTGNSLQGVVIVPFVNDTNKYYLFSLTHNFGNLPELGVFRYSVIDMRLNGGLGDVVSGQKKITIDSNFVEAMTVAATCDGYWVILVKQRTTDFYAYRISEFGFDSKPVVSNIDHDHFGAFSLAAMKVSSNGKRIALSSCYNSKYAGAFQGALAVYDFDRVRGIVSNGMVIDTIAKASFYNCEFSPSSQLLYASCNYRNGSSKIFQYDVSLGDSLLVHASRKSCYSSSGYIGSLQLAPDGKIYVPVALQGLGGISDPDKVYPGCVFTPNVFNMSEPQRNSVGSGLPQHVLFKDVVTIANTKRIDTGFCLAIGQALYVDTSSYGLCIWDDSSLLSHRYISAPGSYWVKMVRNDSSCLADVDTFVITHRGDTVSSRTDTVMCFNESIRLKATGIIGKPQLFWSTGSTERNIVVADTGLYWVSITDDCGISTDTTAVSYKGVVVNMQTDTAICASDSIELYNFTHVSGAAYSWGNGNSGNSIYGYGGQEYILKASKDGCNDSGRVSIAVLPAKEIELGMDKVVCKDEDFQLPEYAAANEGVSYLWHNGSAGEQTTVTGGGVYYVSVTDVCGTISDTVIFTERNCNFFFPTAFSPNGDGKNDFAHLLGDVSVVDDYTLRIYNRWGEAVYQTNDASKGWDGMYKGKKAEVGTYYYIVKYKYDGEEEFIKGDLMLVR